MVKFFLMTKNTFGHFSGHFYATKLCCTFNTSGYAQWWSHQGYIRSEEKDFEVPKPKCTYFRIWFNHLDSSLIVSQLIETFWIVSCRTFVFSARTTVNRSARIGRTRPKTSVIGWRAHVCENIDAKFVARSETMLIRFCTVRNGNIMRSLNSWHGELWPELINCEMVAEIHFIFLFCHNMHICVCSKSPFFHIFDIRSQLNWTLLSFRFEIETFCNCSFENELQWHQ